MSGFADRNVFEALAGAVCGSAAPDSSERISLHLQAEQSRFVRFNQARVRQASMVDQAYVTLALATTAKRIEATLSLTGDVTADRDALLHELHGLRQSLRELPGDPYLLLPDQATTSHRHDRGALPPLDELVRGITTAADGFDFVGFYAGGPLVRAFADSQGTRHWHHVETFHIDWCLYHQADKAVKSHYAGTQWDADVFATRLANGAQHLPLLAAAPRQLSPGAYRVYFAPHAMAELLSTLGWSGFGAHARHTGTSSLSRLGRSDARLHPLVQLDEDTANSMVPRFSADGFAKPSCISLVRDGGGSSTLNCARSARQYGLPPNGANPQESPQALRLAPGTLPPSDALAALDRGVYASNLWYLNYSDRQACRMTGMTRFACFWVDNGRLIAPLAPMRFDDSFLRMFGDGLMALTDHAELVPDSSTYHERQLGSVSTPGALVDGWRLTL